MGDFDYVKTVLDDVADMRWMQVAIKPAKPFAFGVAGAVPVFGLPGNPVSSLVSFELFARPALRQMIGHRHLDRPVCRRSPSTGWPRRSDGKTHFARVTLDQDDAGLRRAVRRRSGITPASGHGRRQRSRRPARRCRRRAGRPVSVMVLGRF